MAVDLTAPSLPLVTSVALSNVAQVVTIGPSVSAVYLYVDDATDPGIGLVATDAATFAPLRGRTPELIYAVPVKGADRDAVIQIKVTAGNVTGYLRVF